MTLTQMSNNELANQIKDQAKAIAKSKKEHAAITLQLKNEVKDRERQSDF